jgi:hypothetical protein
MHPAPVLFSAGNKHRTNACNKKCMSMCSCCTWLLSAPGFHMCIHSARKGPVHVALLCCILCTNLQLIRKCMCGCRYHLPRSYRKLLQSEVAEQFIFNQRAALVQYWQHHQQRLKPLGCSLELLRYALWLTASRTFNYNETHFSLVPLVRGLTVGTSAGYRYT